VAAAGVTTEVAPFPCDVCGQAEDGEHVFAGDMATYWLRPGEPCPGPSEVGYAVGPWIEAQLAQQLDAAALRMLAGLRYSQPIRPAR
jgi:hypothetical protein